METHTQNLDFDLLNNSNRIRDLDKLKISLDRVLIHALRDYDSLIEDLWTDSSLGEEFISVAEVAFDILEEKYIIEVLSKIGKSEMHINHPSLCALKIYAFLEFGYEC